MKASEKQELARQIVARLERQYDPPPSIPERPVLETLIFAVCLENDNYENGCKSFETLEKNFHDLNEVRVSAISELSDVFRHQDEAERRSQCVRAILQFVFEDHFQFDFESMRKKTQEQAAKKLAKIPGISSFIRNYLQQSALGVHVLSLDDRMTNAAIWLGVVDPGSNPEDAAESLKSAVRKADALQVCHYLRCIASLPPGRDVFSPQQFDLSTIPAEPPLKRLDWLLAGGKVKSTKKSVAKSAVKEIAPKVAILEANDVKSPALADTKSTKVSRGSSRDSKPTEHKVAETREKKAEPKASKMESVPAGLKTKAHAEPKGTESSAAKSVAKGTKAAESPTAAGSAPAKTAKKSSKEIPAAADSSGKPSPAEKKAKAKKANHPASSQS